MNVKVIKREFSFDFQVFEYGKHRYLIYKLEYENWLKDNNINLQTSENEPINIPDKFIICKKITKDGWYNSRELYSNHPEYPQFPNIYFYKGILYGISKNKYTDNESQIMIKEYHYKHYGKFEKLMGRNI
jgi:hypothetical protein